MDTVMKIDGFMAGMASKLLTKVIKKKAGINGFDIKIDSLTVTKKDNKYVIRVNAEAEVTEEMIKNLISEL